METLAKIEEFQLRQAGKGDLDSVLGLLVQAAEWLQTKNTSQWDYYITNLEGNTKEVQDSIESDSTYILEHAGKSIATITLEGSPNDWDKEIWGDEESPTGTYYLHRLVVHRNYAGNRLGEKLISWAKDFVKNHGGHSIRFDCLDANEELNAYYQRNYPLKGISNIHGRHSKYEVTV